MSAAQAPRLLYRPMLRDEAGRPRLGERANMLGVRPGFDIPVLPDGNVMAGQGGMSVTPDDPAYLPPHVRPERLGGRGKLPVFVLAATRLGSALSYRPDPGHPGRHGFVEPAGAMPLAAYQTALAHTQDAWEESA